MSEPKEHSFTHSNVNILIAEDSPTQAEQLKYILEQWGYSCTVTRNGREALASISTQRPGVVISDIIMPEMDGFQLCQQIKTDDHFRDIPVILLTALSDPVDVIRGLECGADNFIVKPYDEKDLLSRLEYILANLSLRESEKTRMGVEIFFAGQKHFITSERLQVLNLLLSTYETAVQKNLKLVKVQEELRKLNEQLEEKIKERTAALIAEIAERKQLEEQFRQSQKMEAIGQLAGGVAHDFNNLLVVIIGYADLRLAGLDQNDPLSKDLAEIKQAGERAAVLTRQLLAFSRKQVLQPQILELNTVVTGMDKMLQRLIGEHIDLVTVPDSSLGRVKADPGQIEQIILNIAVNARDAMPDGGMLTIETANVELDEDYTRLHLGVQPGPYVMLAVSDTGCGMDKETQAHIFEPFFTTKEKGKGTGLGLSTVYGIVQQSGGHIEVYSEVGQGTTFKVYLPRLEDTAQVRTSSQARAELSRGTETLLLVEDEQAVRGLARWVLQKAGYTVLEAANGEDALHLCTQHAGPIHLLVTDIVMPHMSGRMLAERLGRLYPETRVLYMSGYMDDAIVRHGVLEVGMAFLQKPFTPETLARKVREVLDAET